SVLEATQLTPYLWGLMGFITVCTLFEYYDALILNLALPYLGRDFRADARELGLAVGAIQLGTVAAFFLVRLADRYGRRPVLLLSIVGYSLFTFLTAFSQGLYDLVAYQFVARALMVTEVGVGSIVLAEELPAR
ncbi:MAG: MFS transporter, partial [Chloroflexota bacterium]